jgi:hypothetical protein
MMVPNYVVCFGFLSSRYTLKTDIVRKMEISLQECLNVRMWHTNAQEGGDCLSWIAS